MARQKSSFGKAKILFWQGKGSRLKRLFGITAQGTHGRGSVSHFLMGCCLILVCLCIVGSLFALPLEQENSLRALHSATGGSSWLVPWNLTHSPCNWFGVFCGSNTVLAIILPSNNLTGTLPDFLLPDLDSLYVPFVLHSSYFLRRYQP